MIESISVIGVSCQTSSTKLQPFLLWHPFKKTLASAAYPSEISFSIQIYPDFYFDHVNPSIEFEYRAAVKQLDLQTPEGITEWIIPAGLYAIFEHVGSSDTFSNTLTGIYMEWLPQSGYRLDARPHFQRMDERYRLNDPDSIEEIWIPIVQK